MTISDTNSQMPLTETIASVFRAFCNDISEMFSVNITCSQLPVALSRAEKILTQFEKLPAFIRVRADGDCSVDFQIILERQGLFILAGIVAMRTEAEILENCEKGTYEDAEELHDAVAETGNLLVAIFNRVFVQAESGDFHFTKVGISIGNPQDEENVTIKKDKEILYCPCEISVHPFGAFQCGIMLPESEYQNMIQSDEKNVLEQAVEGIAETEPGVDAAEHEESVQNGDHKIEHRESSGGAVSEAIEEMMQSMSDSPHEYARNLLEIQVRDFMQKEITWGNPDDSVQQAMQALQQTGADYMLVGDPDALLGIVSRNDLAETVSVYLRPLFSKWRRPADDATLKIRIKVIMTSPVHTISDHASLSEMLKEMCHFRLRCLPVVNEKGHVEGLVSAFEIFNLLLN